ncbi:hypothetical protein GCM10023170_088680 [Phytohabitans houttuyneae]
MRRSACGASAAAIAARAARRAWFACSAVTVTVTGAVPATRYHVMVDAAVEAVVLTQFVIVSPRKVAAPGLAGRAEA